MKLSISLDSHETHEFHREDGEVEKRTALSSLKVIFTEESNENVKMKFGYEETYFNKAELEDMKCAIEMFLGRMK